MQAESTEPDEEPDLFQFPHFDSVDFAECLHLGLVPKDAPNHRLIQELTAVFVDAAILARNAPQEFPLDPVPDDRGVLLRSIMDQKAEEIREKATEAEPRAAALYRQIGDHGPNANPQEYARALDRINQAVLELRRLGIVVMARSE